MSHPLTTGTILTLLLSVVAIAQRPSLASDAPATNVAALQKGNDSQVSALKKQIEQLKAELQAKNVPAGWLVIGFVGQFIFGFRFIVQWIATERKKKSVVPVAFWYLSLGGTVVLLSYSIYKRDPVFIAGFSLNMIIYLRNLYFIHSGPAKVKAGD